MAKTKELLSEDTIIVRRPFPISDEYKSLANEYLKFFKQTLGDKFKTGENGRMGFVGRLSFQDWIPTQTGKTLKEAATEWSLQLDAYANQPQNQSLEEKLKGRRYNHIPETDKAFIVTFDKTMNEYGYDFGSNFEMAFIFSISYGKTGTKSRPIAANVFVKSDGKVQLRFHLNKVDTHREYIENTPPHIKQAFTFDGGDCTGCNSNFCSGKAYTIDGKSMHKCNHRVFYFDNATLENLPAYMELFSKFYPLKK